jgi:transposase InsO family protein
VADISEFKCRDGKLYLAGIKDFHDKDLPGWSMCNRQTADLVVAALVMALGRRMPDFDENTEPVHHSDKSGQYMSLEFTGGSPTGDSSRHTAQPGTASITPRWNRPGGDQTRAASHLRGLGDHDP